MVFKKLLKPCCERFLSYHPFLYLALLVYYIWICSVQTDKQHSVAGGVVISESRCRLSRCVWCRPAGKASSRWTSAGVKDSSWALLISEHLVAPLLVLCGHAQEFDKNHVRLNRDPVSTMLSKTTVHELTRQAVAAQEKTAKTTEETLRKPSLKRSGTETFDVPKHIRLQVLSDSCGAVEANVVVALLLMSLLKMLQNTTLQLCKCSSVGTSGISVL